MKLSTCLFNVVLTGLLLFCLAETGQAAELSSCVTCHLDEAMIVKNLSGSKTKISAMQSGSG